MGVALGPVLDTSPMQNDLNISLSISWSTKPSCALLLISWNTQSICPCTRQLNIAAVKWSHSFSCFRFLGLLNQAVLASVYRSCVSFCILEYSTKLSLHQLTEHCLYQMKIFSFILLLSIIWNTQSVCPGCRSWIIATIKCPPPPSLQFVNDDLDYAIKLFSLPFINHRHYLMLPVSLCPVIY